MPNIDNIAGVAIASIANFGGNANIASVGGVDAADITPPYQPDSIYVIALDTIAQGHATLSENSGYFGWCVTPSECNPAPTPDEIRYGAVPGATDYGEEEVSGVNMVWYIEFLTGNTFYYLYCYHSDLASNKSPVASTTFSTQSP